jgi:hypothetical protein
MRLYDDERSGDHRMQIFEMIYFFVRSHCREFLPTFCGKKWGPTQWKVFCILLVTKVENLLLRYFVASKYKSTSVENVFGIFWSQKYKSTQ